MDRQELILAPTEGTPGSTVTLVGKGWPARRKVVFFITIESPKGTSLRTRVASLAASRNGTFRTDLSIPPSLIGQETREVFIEAESMAIDGTPLKARPLAFRILAYPNELAIRVVSSDSKLALSGARLSLMDHLGRTTQQILTDSSGLATITNIRPGVSRLYARTGEHRNSEFAVKIPDSGYTRIWIEMEADPDKRLYLPFIEQVGFGAI